MEKKRILLVGSDGQVGSELQKSLLQLDNVEIITSAYEGGDYPIDLRESGKIRELIRKLSPRLVINAAAYTAVDKAESDQEAAFAINTAAPKDMAEAAKEVQGAMVHFSTDYVYGSDEKRFLLESDHPNPRGVYAVSKWQGDQAVAASGAPYWVLRTSWVYGVHGANFVKTMLRLGKDREELSVVCDQIGAPTSAETIASVCAKMLAKEADFYRLMEKTRGVYHVVNSDVTSWHGFAEEIFELAKAHNYSCRVNQLHAIASEKYPTPAPRPTNSKMSLKKLEERFSIKPEPWRAALRRSFADIAASV